MLGGPHVHDLCKECLAAVLRSDLLKASEKDVYEAALRWASAECGRRGRGDSGWDRRVVLGSAFCHIRFPLLPARYFLDHVMRYDILTMREKLELTRFFLDSDKYPLQTFTARRRAYKEPAPPPPKRQPAKHSEGGPRGGRTAGGRGGRGPVLVRLGQRGPAEADRPAALRHSQEDELRGPAVLVREFMTWLSYVYARVLVVLWYCCCCCYGGSTWSLEDGEGRVEGITDCTVYVRACRRGVKVPSCSRNC